MAVEYIFEDTTRESKALIGKGRLNCGADDCEACRECDPVGAVFPEKEKKLKLKGRIRRAYERDIPAMREIYNYEVVNGVATFDMEPRSLSDRQEWFFAHRSVNHIIYVAEHDGIILGYASLSPYRLKDAFEQTVELSVYIDPMYRGKGVAQALLASVLYYARKTPSIHNVVSVITSGNEASVRLHEKFGFTFCGTMPEVGIKHGQLLGIDNFCLIV